jgi:hypothetical protein
MIGSERLGEFKTFGNLVNNNNLTGIMPGVQTASIVA